MTGTEVHSARRADATDAVKVCVRVRPLTTKEKQEQTKSCLRIANSIDGLTLNSADDHGPQQLVVGKDRAFTFDTILGVDSDQEVTRKTPRPSS